MGLSEFNLIKRYFSHEYPSRQDVKLGVGDDAAITQCPPGQQLVMSLDTLVSGVHFPDDTSPDAIAYKALAVNLSDMAAMGAEPAWMMLGLTLPSVDESWLQAFAASLGRLAGEHQVALIGGDTTRGPLTISVQITGFVPEGQALTRKGAKVGDLIYVTGQIGDAGLGLQLKLNQTKLNQASLELHPDRHAYFIQRLEQPTPRVAAGIALRGLANAAIDVSDGLAADLGHILELSNVGAVLTVDNLPVAEELRTQHLSWWQQPLISGDDYELCFTVPLEKEAEMLTKMAALGCPVTPIGRIEPIIKQVPSLRLVTEKGEVPFEAHGGYQHFD